MDVFLVEALVAYIHVILYVITTLAIIIVIHILFQMKEASSYDERAAIRKAIRQLKKEQGRPVGRATRREATYNRFAGRNTAATATATPRSYIVSKETSSVRQACPQTMSIASL